jgi:hypothetical protein
MTCSSSSNIRSTQTLVSITQGGSRLTAVIPDGSYSSGITGGDVIYWNPLGGGGGLYEKSNASTSASAEVFGVVENVTQTGASSYALNVVLYGSIILPSSAIYTIAGATGGAGGADVYFLSGISAGKIQVEAPSTIGHVIKPVYQVAPHGSYTGTVVNYIGYRLGGEIEAFTDPAENLTGTVSFLVNLADTVNPVIPANYVDARISHELLVSIHPSFYNKYGKQFGFVEEITLKPGYLADASKIGKVTVTRTSDSTLSSGSILATANDNKYYIRWPGTASTTTSSQKLKISDTFLEVQSSSVYSVFTPKINTIANFSIFDVNGNNISADLVPIMKLNPEELSVNIPQNVVISEATIQTIKLGTESSNDNVGTVLTDLENRLSAVEARLLM